MGTSKIPDISSPLQTSGKRPLNESLDNNRSASSSKISTPNIHDNSATSNDTSKLSDGNKRRKLNSSIQHQLRRPAFKTAPFTGLSEKKNTVRSAIGHTHNLHSRILDKLLNESAQPSDKASLTCENNINDETLEQENTINGDLYSQLRTKVTEYNNNQGQQLSPQSPNSHTLTNPYASLLFSLKEETLEKFSQEYSFSSLAQLVNNFPESQPDVAELYFSLAAISGSKNENPNKLKTSYKNAASILHSYHTDTKTIDSMCSLLPKDLERCLQERNRIFDQRHESAKYYKNKCAELGIIGHNPILPGFKDENEKVLFKSLIEAETSQSQRNKKHSSFFPDLSSLQVIKNHSCFENFRQVCLETGSLLDVFSGNQDVQWIDASIINSPRFNDFVLEFRKYVFQHKLQEEERQVTIFKSTYKQDVIQLVNDNLREGETHVNSLEDLQHRVTNDYEFSFHHLKTKKFFARKIFDYIHNHGTKIFYFSQSTTSETPVTRSSLNTHYTSLRIDQCDDKKYKVIYMDSLGGSATEWKVDKKILRAILKNIAEIYYSPEEFLSNRTIPHNQDLPNLILNDVDKSIINTNHVNSDKLKQDGTKCGSQSVLNALRFNFDKALKAQELEKTSNSNDTSHIEDNEQTNCITDLDRHRAVSFVKKSRTHTGKFRDRFKYNLINIIFDDNNKKPLFKRLVGFYDSVCTQSFYSKDDLLSPIIENFFFFPENCRSTLIDFYQHVSSKLYSYRAIIAASYTNEESILKAITEHLAVPTKKTIQANILATAHTLLEHRESQFKKRKNIILPNGSHASQAFITLVEKTISELKDSNNIKTNKIISDLLSNRAPHYKALRGLDALYYSINNENPFSNNHSLRRTITTMYIKLSLENFLESSLLKSNGSIIEELSKIQTDQINNAKQSFSYKLIYGANNFDDVKFLLKEHLENSPGTKHYDIPVEVLKSIFSEVHSKSTHYDTPMDRNVRLITPFIISLIETLKPMNYKEKRKYLSTHLT